MDTRLGSLAGSIWCAAFNCKPLATKAVLSMYLHDFTGKIDISWIYLQVFFQ
jgi:hypothetical protein